MTLKPTLDDALSHLAWVSSIDAAWHARAKMILDAGVSLKDDAAEAMRIREAVRIAAPESVVHNGPAMPCPKCVAWRCSCD